MLCLTADRPPELRQTGANQTIVQPNIFGEYVRWSFDLPAPDLSIDPASVLTTVDQAAYRSRRAPKGPVHLNLMFREPFLGEPEVEGEGSPDPAGWVSSDAPYTHYADTKPALGVQEVERLWEELRPAKRGLIVAGRLESRAQGEAVARLAESIGWPLLADVGSQVRFGVEPGNRVAHYEALLATERFWGDHEPDAVLHFGGRALSKRLEQALARTAPDPYVVVREDPFRLDPVHRVTQSVEADVVEFCGTLSELVTTRPSKAEPGWLVSWSEASENAGSLLDARIIENDQLSEPSVARLISRNVPREHGLVLASSMPIRDMDTFAAADGVAVSMAANRGASGIDGTVATAAGFARGREAPATLVIGDLALLHDLNSLSMLRERPPVVVVVLNNDGGGIFSFLPVAGHAEFFEPYFGTPQGVGFEPAATMFGLEYANPETVSGFLEAYKAACGRSSSTLIEVKTDRQENVKLHRELLEGLYG
jgi:2-succinyl-5-enolpyruvyl-6-hydroxy-3-cyclohexene-1-carboxylate synthase